MASGDKKLLATPRPDDPFEGRTVGSYALRHRVGSGGMSRVYLARDTRTGDTVAIKFLRSAFVNLHGFVRRFEREAAALERLDHLNCVSVFDHGVADDTPYLVIEYVGGQTLEELIAKGPIAPVSAVRIAEQILAGLQHAHARSVIHRDLKPSNVMLIETTSAEKVVKIMDFGTAQILEGGDTGLSSGTDIGTPWYMAPEQASGQPTDHRADLYALGVILFEMLTGERPFRAENPLRVLQMQISSPTPSPRALKPEVGLSPEMEDVIVTAMQKNPGRRFTNAEAFSGALSCLPELRPKRPTQRALPALDEFDELDDIVAPALDTSLGREPITKSPWRAILWAFGAAATIGAAMAYLLIAR